MRNRCLTILLSVALSAVMASWALAQPTNETQATTPIGREGERPRNEGDPGERGPMGDRGRMIDVEQAVEADITWLREHDLGVYADKVAELVKSENPLKRVILWRMHRRIEGWKRLQGDDLRRALEDVRLEFAIPKLALAARAAPADESGDAARKALRQAVERQADLRIELSKAFCDMIEKRLAEFREQLDKQAKLREDLVSQRLASLTAPETPLPDPLKDLVMEASDFGRSERPDGESPPAPPPEEGDGKKLEPPPPSDEGDGKRPEPRGSSAKGSDGKNSEQPPLSGQGPFGRMAEMFDKQIEADIAWLRENDLAPFAAGLEALHKEGNRFLLWQIHRRIRQIMSLRGEDQAQAIEAERLRFKVIELAKQWRDAAAEARTAIAEKLKEALNRQFDLRLKAQEAIMTAIKKRLEEAQTNVETLRKHRDEVVQRRYEELLDATKAIPEPSLVPERPDQRRPSRGDRERDGGRRSPEDNPKSPQE